MTVRRTLTVLAATAVLLAAAALPAVAHARLETSDPPGGATLEQAPSAVTLTFNEDIEPSFAQVQVTGPDGARVDQGAPATQGPVVAVPLQPLTVPGTHAVAFRVVSTDGHPVEATLTFDLAAVPTAAEEPSLTAVPDAGEAAGGGEGAAPDDASPPPGPEPAAPEVTTVPASSQGPSRSSGVTTLAIGAAVIAALAAGAYLLVRRRVAANPGR